MASSTNHQFISVLITILVIFKTSLAFENYSSVDVDLPFAPKHVIIINTLNPHERLVVHCRNKGKDLGVHALEPQEQIDFRFRVNLRKTTTYTCTFSWPGNAKTFDIFKVDRDDNSKSTCGICRECIWYICETGPCRARRDGGAPFCFSWTS
ncbi:Plant self-incompatibility S1 [Arabidopsis suecica]|uniref:S-protein homolog n=1 Tax=Arabidopsis suecica TaxID=45249 RepID=A0A8T2H8I4_ARASU|nr:Plant self-incompatibility S1 [Arabidopsis suecica]